MKTLRNISLLFVLALSTAFATAQEFELRFVQTSCNTFRVDARCVNSNYVPVVGTGINAFDFGIISTGSYTLSIDTNNYLQGSFGQTGNGTVNGYNYYFYSLNTTFNISSGNGWTLNTWKSIVSFTINSGTTLLQGATDALTNFTFGAYIVTSGTNAYAGLNEMGVSSTINQLYKTWTGDDDSDWTITTNWCPTGSPVTGENLVIPNSSNQPIIQSATSVNNIEIKSGAILGLDNKVLTVAGNLTGSGFIKGGGASSLVLSGSNGNLDSLSMDTSVRGSTNVLQNLTLSGSNNLLLVKDSLQISGILTLTEGTFFTNDKVVLISNSANSYGQIAKDGNGELDGSITMQKTLSALNGSWKQISLPLSGTLTNLSGVAVNTSSHTPAGERNIYWYNAANNGSGAHTGWTEADSSDNFTKGYMLYCDSGDAVLKTGTRWSFKGDYSNGNKNYGVTHLSLSSADQEGWNLIPNPYPSNIDVSVLLNSSAFSSIAYDAVHVWDAATEQYRAITKTGVTAITSYNTNDTILNDGTDIGPFQAFWIKVDNSGTFTLPNSARTTAMGGVRNFFKKNYDLLRVNVSNSGNGAKDQVVVYFANSATQGLDNGLDAYKLRSLNPDMPSLSMVTDKGEELSINALPEGELSYSQAIRFASQKEGLMTISLDREAFDASWRVYIEDKQTGKLHEFTGTEYTFTKSSSDMADRFVLHISRYALSANDNSTIVEEGIAIHSHAGALQLVTADHFNGQEAQIEITDLSGRQVYSSAIILKSGIQEFSGLVRSHGLYFVNLRVEGIIRKASVVLKP